VPTATVGVDILDVAKPDDREPGQEPADIVQVAVVVRQDAPILLPLASHVVVHYAIARIGIRGVRF
jgi:hypothetical protein